MDFEQPFHSNCNIMSGMYKGLGRWEGAEWVVGEDGQPEAG